MNLNHCMAASINYQEIHIHAYIHISYNITGEIALKRGVKFSSIENSIHSCMMNVSKDVSYTWWIILSIGFVFQNFNKQFKPNLYLDNFGNTIFRDNNFHKTNHRIPNNQQLEKERASRMVMID